MKEVSLERKNVSAIGILRKPKLYSDSIYHSIKAAVRSKNDKCFCEKLAYIEIFIFRSKSIQENVQLIRVA